MLIRLLFVACLMGIAARSSRHGLFAFVLGAVLQDVLRKIDATEPTGFLWTGLAGLLLLATAGGMVVRGEFRRSRWQTGDPVRVTLNLLTVIVLLQACVAYARTERVAVPILGLAMYAFPLIALRVGLVIGRNPRHTSRLLSTYVVIASVGLGAMLLAKAGIQHPMLRGIGKELVTYGPTMTGVVRLEQGLFRAPEIAGWHASMVLCICILWAGAAHARAWIPLSLFSAVAALWTGRRKWLLVPTIAVAVAQVAAVWTGVRGVRSLLRTTALVVLVVLGVGVVVASSGEFSETRAHVLRLQLLERHGGDRVVGLGRFGALDVLDRIGWLGGGVGIAQQGTRHLIGERLEDPGWGAEGGLGQLLAEIGVPGVLAVIALVIAIAQGLLGGIRNSMRRRDDRTAWLLVWGGAALLANALAFLLAKQAFGDPFVVGWLGLLAGFLLARAAAGSGQAAPRASFRLDVRTSAGSGHATPVDASSSPRGR